MVRVISVHHFSRQDVSSCPTPTASTLAGPSTLVLATDGQFLEVRDLDSKSENTSGKLSHSFQTLDRVSKIVYAPVGKFLLTVEGRESFSVRAYVNWSDPRTDNAPIKPRVVARVSPNSKTHHISEEETGFANAVWIDMIEFPQRDEPLAIDVCESTGNVIVAAANLVIVYKYIVKKIGDSSFVDFHECFHVFHNFIPTEVSLCEDVIGVLSPAEVHVFKVKISSENRADDSSTSGGFKSISMYSFSESSPESLPPSTSSLNRRLSNASECSSTSTATTTNNNTVGLNSPMSAASNNNQKIKNITLSRQQDSETDDCRHLDGYGGNVKSHPNRVDLARPGREFILGEVEAANRDFNSMIGSPKILDQSLGPCSPPISRQTTVKYVQHHEDPTVRRGGDFEAECITMIHCRLNRDGERNVEMLRNLRLKPVFWREFRVRRSGSATKLINQENSSSKSSGKTVLLQHPLQSQFHVHLMSITAVFTSINEGYLYHLPGHLRRPGKGCGVRRTATYPFTSKIVELALEPTLLHAITETGLETYTLRSGFSSVYEAEAINDRTTACPTGEDLPICLVGLRPFIGARNLMVSPSYLVILCSNSDTTNQSQVAQTEEGQEKKWTLYSLTLPTPLDLHRDMMQLAAMNMAISPQGYFQLLCEAHICVRTALHHLTWTLASTGTILWPSPASKPSPTPQEILQNVRETYRDTCYKMAEYYLTSSDPDSTKMEWKLALPYFRMSQKPLTPTLKQSVKLWEEHKAKESKKQMSQQQVSKISTEQKLPPGLIHYIKAIVMKPVRSENLLEASLADEIITLLGEKSLETLAYLAVRCPSFREFKTSKIASYFRSYFESLTTDSLNLKNSVQFKEKVLAFCLLCVDQGEIKDAEEALQKFVGQNDGIFAGVLINNHDRGILLDDEDEEEEENENAKEKNEQQKSVTFTNFANVLRAVRPNLFVEVLVSLVNGGVYRLPDLLRLFIGSLFDESAAEKEKTNNESTAILQLFLETFFVEFLENPNALTVSETTGFTPEFEESLLTLLRSYLSGLTVPVRFDERNIDTGDMFGRRFDYLDNLPPFTNDLVDEDSPEFWCQNSLLKLQSLLCTKEFKSLSQWLNSTVQSYLSKFPNAQGALSLKVLCANNSEEALSILCESFPNLVLQYAVENELTKDLSQSEAAWRLVLEKLQTLQRLSSEAGSIAGSVNGDSDLETDNMHESWYSALQEVLDFLAKNLTLEEFLKVLPEQTNINEDLEGYIQMCKKNQKAADLQALIVSTGNKLLASQAVG